MRIEVEIQPRQRLAELLRHLWRESTASLCPPHSPKQPSGSDVSPSMKLRCASMASDVGCGGLSTKMVVSWRDRAEPPQHQGCQTFADPAPDETRPFAQADNNRQTPLLWSSKASGHAECEDRSHKGLNNRAENSQLPFRKRERMRQGFRILRRPQSFRSRSHKTPLPTKFAITYCKAWLSGKPLVASSSETVSTVLTCPSFKPSDSASAGAAAIEQVRQENCQVGVAGMTR